MNKILIVLPTYNERENVLSLIQEIRRHTQGLDILVVDDQSPDGTGDAVEKMAQEDRSLFLLRRPQKNGLGRAYVTGFEWALGRGYEWIGQMDSDHSHRVQDLVAILGEVKKGQHDFIIGSRWMKGGAISNWHWSRVLLSRAGNLYVRLVLGAKFYDWTGGFNIWRSKVLTALQIGTLESQGYSFQIEMKYRAFRLNFSGFEVPIVFEERREGQSKMSLRIIIEALLRVWVLKSKFNSR